MNEAEKEQLRQLLTSAEAVRPKLLSMLTLGPRSLEHDAYAMKARVKSFDSAVAKIAEKRKTNPNYGPETLTDVIGIRILTLWPDDISKVLEKLVTTIKDVNGTILSSFRSTRLADVIAEVIVYKAPNSPAIYDVIGDQLIDWLSFDTSLDDKVSVRPSPRDRPYSSIHMVIWCRTPVAGGWAQIPVEIQVRTSLEDVWSEADHRLRYKAQGLPTAGRDQDIGRKLLTDLKAQLDIAASSVTSARDLLTATPPEPGASVARVPSPPDPLTSLGMTAAPAPVRDKVLGLHSALNTFYRDFEAGPAPWADVWQERFPMIETAIRDVMADVEVSAPAAFAKGDAEGPARWRFWCGMELAQVAFWQARLGREAAARAGDDASVIKADAMVEACLHGYIQLMSSPPKAGSAMLWFRFGNALLELKGDFVQAAIYLRRAKEDLSSDPSVATDSPYRVIIPRMYAYCLWRVQNVQFLDAASRYGVKPPVAAYGIDQIREALCLMVPLTRQITRVSADSGLWDAAVEQRKVDNNLISYAWYLGLRSAQSEGIAIPTQAQMVSRVRSSVTQNVLATSYKRLASAVDAADTSPMPSTLHTLAAGAFLAGNRKGLDSAATQLTGHLDNAGTTGRDTLSASDAAQMRADLEILMPKGQ